MRTFGNKTSERIYDERIGEGVYENIPYDGNEVLIAMNTDRCTKLRFLSAARNAAGYCSEHPESCDTSANS